jgi:hypothetical protein
LGDEIIGHIGREDWKGKETNSKYINEQIYLSVQLTLNLVRDMPVMSPLMSEEARHLFINS